MPDGLSIVKSEPLPAAATPPPAPTPAAPTGGLTIAKSEAWPDLIGAEATRQGVDPNLARAVAEQESGFDPHARSSAGALGLMQLMPATAARWKVDPTNPTENIRGGVSELKQLLAANGGNTRAALMRYNGSPSADPAVTGAYADQVIGRMTAAAQQGRPQMTFATVNGQRVPVSPDEPQMAAAHAAPAATPPPTAPAVHATPAGGWNKMTASMGAQPPPSGAVMDPETERILGGAGGGALGGFLTGGPVGAAIGAGIGGATVATAQGHPEEAPAAGLTQAGYEAGAQLAMWPLQAVGRRLIASTVAKNAAKYLEDTRVALNGKLDGILASAKAAQRAVAEGVAGAKATAGATARDAQARVVTAQNAARADSATAQRGVTTAADAARASVAGARAGVGDAEQLAAQRMADEADQWLKGGRHAATPPPGPEGYGPAGTAAANVIQGQGQHSLDQLGQLVTKASKTGPPVNIGPVKDAITRMGSRLQTSTEKEAAVHAAADAGGHSPEATAALIQAMKDQGVEIEPGHAFLGAVGRIQAHPDVVPFADAHILKRALDDSISSFEGPAKKQVGQITKGVRGQLRTAMEGHAPYDAATAAYQDAVPLVRKGYAAKITRAVVDDPTAIARTIKPNEPLRLQMLHDVLTGAGPLDPSVRADVEAGAAAATTPPTGAGHGAEGQQAWDAVRAAVVYERLIKPGIANFDTALAKFHPDSLKLLSEGPGGAILDNLKQMSEAYKASPLYEPGIEAAKGRATAAVTQGAASVRMARGAARDVAAQGAASVEAARVPARAAAASAAATSQQGSVTMREAASHTGDIREQVRLGKQSTAEETAFQNSSLAATPPPGQTASDILHAGAMHGMNVFRARAIGRLLLQGPKGADLIEWSSRSSLRTQAFVRAVTSPAPGMALANIARTAGITLEDEPPMAVSHPQQPVATPPPGPVAAATPPPR
jgi:hypothetical protein